MAEVRPLWQTQTLRQVLKHALFMAKVLYNTWPGVSHSAYSGPMTCRFYLPSLWATVVRESSGWLNVLLCGVFQPPFHLLQFLYLACCSVWVFLLCVLFFTALTLIVIWKISNISNTLVVIHLPDIEYVLIPCSPSRKHPQYYIENPEFFAHHESVC